MHVELLNRKKWRTRLETINAIFEYIEVYYDRSRRHSVLNWKSHTVFDAARGTQRISA
jgi:transposase InsO family protein